jgi:predicted metal-binding membrane protein
MLLEKNPPSGMAMGWAIMVVAMMAPLMCHCIQHVLETSLARRRFRALMLFLLGYLVVWMAAAFLLLPIALTVKLFAPTSLVAIVVASILALVWQTSPVKQRCLNRTHSHPSLAPFGPRADLDAVKFGLVHGLWCFSSCWALMLLAELLPSGHLLAMALFTLWLLAEQLDRPFGPQWRLRGIGKAVRVSVVQIRSALAWGLRTKSRAPTA